MAKIEVNGVGLAYEILGEGERAVAITPGGRYSKAAPGVRSLAQALAQDGCKVLIWDRPNSGESDISFDGETESLMCADALAGLLRALDFGPTLLVGGSAGSRASLLAALRHPQVAKALFLLWISGGPIGLTVLAMHYCAESGLAAARGGMERVAALPMFKEPLECNPGNRDRLLGIDPQAFIARMQDWVRASFTTNGSPVPGLRAEDFAALRLPVLILRSGASDIHHPRAISEAVHRLIPGSRLAEPPWGDNEWNERLAARDETGEGLFSRWALLAAPILRFSKEVWPS